MPKFQITQTGEELQNILDNAASRKDIPIESGEGEFSIKTKGVEHIVRGNGAVAFGGSTPNTASGISSFAEGKDTIASGSPSHSEGTSTVAEGSHTHAEGFQTKAIGNASHAEGKGTISNGAAAHVEGDRTTAKGDASHAEGLLTETTNRAEHAQGMFNISHPNTIHSIGIGAAATRQNAEETYLDGRKFLYKIGGYDGTNPDNSKSVQEVINGKQDKLTTGTGIDISNNTISCTLDTTIFTVISSLPTSPAAGDEKKIHLVPSSTFEESNTYDEYLWVNNAWEKVGSFIPTIDLSEYAKTSYIDESLSTIRSSKLDKILEVTWTVLKSLKDNSQLVPGQQYRITDYKCTTTQTDTQSANHIFDIIVIADSVNKLNCKARAVLHKDDTYFTNSQLDKWELWYDLDNDVTKYNWADETKGKGVIYRMIDEFGNDCPYDFKNIQFKRHKILRVNSESSRLVGKFTTLGVSYIDASYNASKYLYTFSWIDGSGNVLDYSIVGNSLAFKNNKHCIGVYSNKIHPISDYKTAYTENLTVLCYGLNDICFISDATTTGGPSYGCYGNTVDCNCKKITFDNNCHENTIGSDCYNLVFGVGVKLNSFGKGCHDLVVNNDFLGNSLGNECASNLFGYSHHYNIWGNSCYNNIFGNGFNANEFGSSFHNSVLGNSFSSNRFGINCYNVNIKNTTSDTSETLFYCSIGNGVTLTLELERGLYNRHIYKNSEGRVKIFNIADLIQ